MRVWFKTDKKACDFKLMVRDTSKVDVSYPGGRAYTSLYDDDTLRKGEVDYATFFVKTGDYNRDTWQLLFATMSWKWCGTNRVQTKSTGFLLPVDAS